MCMVDGIEWDELVEKEDGDTRVFASALSVDGMGSDFLPARVLKYVTCIAIETHNSNRKHDGIHREATSSRLSVDIPLLSKTILPSIVYILLLAVAGVR